MTLLPISYKYHKNVIYCKVLYKHWQIFFSKKSFTEENNQFQLFDLYFRESFSLSLSSSTRKETNKNLGKHGKHLTKSFTGLFIYFALCLGPDF